MSNQSKPNHKHTWAEVARELGGRERRLMACSHCADTKIDPK